MKFKNLFSVALAAVCVGALASCGETAPTTPTEAPTTAPTTAPLNVMSYQEYVQAADGTDVSIAGYVQAKQSWWSNKATVYLMDDNGGYFIYNLPCTQEAFDTDLAIGNYIKVDGLKGSWAGMAEVLGSESGAEATYEVLEGNKVYQAKAMNTLNSDELVKYLSQKVSFAELTVVSVELPSQTGGDIYYDVTDGENILTFAVESYLTSASTEVYQTAMTLKAGDTISAEGFMYCYYSAQLHTTAMTITGNVFTKSAEALTYAEYVATADGADVVIEAFVQGKQSWWDNKGTFYLADQDGAYFVYELPCTQEEYNQLTVGTKIKVEGVKGSWKGMVEILGSESGAEATFEILPGKYLAPAKKISLSAENILSYSTQTVAFENLTVVSVSLPTQDGGDIYYDVTDGTTTLTFAVESYLTSASTEVYQAVLALQAGDKINCEGFLYVYENAQLHTTSVSKVTE